MKILGISAYYNNAAACIIKDGEILAAAQEERFTRKISDPSFPKNAIDYCLNYSKLDLKDMDAIAIHDKPLLKFERLLETHYAFAPKGIRSFLASMPIWIREKVFLRSLIYKELKKLRKVDPRKIKLLFSEHHLSHAASVFYTSSFREAAILVIDGAGEWATTSICHGHDSKIKIIKELRFPHSIGLLHKSFAFFLGCRSNSGIEELSTYASFGDKDAGETAEYVQKIKKHLVEVKHDGSISLNQDYFQYTTGAYLTDDSKWELLFGLPKRLDNQELNQQHCNLAIAICTVLDEVIRDLCLETKRLTNADCLCIAGELAMDSCMTNKIRESGIFNDIFVQPASGDEGAAMGAALAVNHLYFRQAREIRSSYEQLKGCLLGPEYTSIEILKALEDESYQYYRYDDQMQLLDEVSDLIAEGKIIGLFHGRMEFGPNALLNRSILADPRNIQVKQRLNKTIKDRDELIPFPVSVLAEEARELFDLNQDSPFKMLKAKIHSKYASELPEDYESLSIKEKNNVPKSQFPGVSNDDLYTRIQTVKQSENPLMHYLLRRFKEKSQTGMILHTSLSTNHDPIACTPDDALRIFKNTEIDYLVMNCFMISKRLNIINQHRAETAEYIST